MALILALFASIVLTAVIVSLGFISARKRITTILSIFVSYTLLFFFSLLLLENWFYSLFSVGLKSGDSILVKLLFISGSLFISHQLITPIKYLADKAKMHGWLPIIFSGLLSLTFVASLNNNAAVSKLKNPIIASSSVDNEVVVSSGIICKAFSNEESALIELQEIGMTNIDPNSANWVICPISLDSHQIDSGHIQELEEVKLEVKNIGDKSAEIDCMLSETLGQQRLKKYSRSLELYSDFITNLKWKNIQISSHASSFSIKCSLPRDFSILSLSTNVKKDKSSSMLNTLFISSDGLDSEIMSIYSNSDLTTPFLDSISDELMIFENAYTNNANTTGSITSVLNGISPLTSKVVYPPDILRGEDSFNSLPAILGANNFFRTQWALPHFASGIDQRMLSAFDYIHGNNQTVLNNISGKLPGIQEWFIMATYRHTLGVVLDVFGLKELYNPFFEVADSGTPPRRHRLNDKIRMTGLINDLTRALKKKIPIFSQVHFMDTHGGKFNPSRRIFSNNIKQTRPWMSPFYKDTVLDFDSRLSRIYQVLKGYGQLDNTIIVIFSDHSQGWQSQVKIPLLIRLPMGERAGRYGKNVQLIDIAPTILDYLGAPLPHWMEGKSLLRYDEIPEDRMIFIAGVGKREKNSVGEWVRAKTQDMSFEKQNNFTVIYCGLWSQTYDLSKKLQFQVLPGSTSSKDCNSINESELPAEALKRLQSYF